MRFCTAWRLGRNDTEKRAPRICDGDGNRCGDAASCFQYDAACGGFVFGDGTCGTYGLFRVFLCDHEIDGDRDSGANNGGRLQG